MELLTKEKERTLTASLCGELDHHAAREVMQKLEYAVEADTPHELILDFSGVTFMDSSGIAVVLRAQKRMATLGGRLVLQDLPPQAKKVFDTAGVSRMVSIR